jgi:dipeptide transport system ATP-binding protein
MAHFTTRDRTTPVPLHTPPLDGPAARKGQGQPLLRVEGLKTTVYINGEPLNAVDDISFDLREGEVLGLVGESAAGKSMTAMSVIGLVRPPGRITAGSIVFNGTDLRTLSEREMETVRGKEIAMITQDPMTALNPVKTIGDQMVRVIRLHTGVDRREAADRAVEMMRRVGISSPQDRLKAYPHQFSGGMLQRISIAMALSCSPKLLIADEPTTALDVTVQAQVLALLMRVRDERAQAILLITHDLAVVAETADRAVVMYAGQVMETGTVPALFDAPRHPYTRALLDASPGHGAARERLRTIPGVVPGAAHRPPGCLLAPRCAFAAERCTAERPAMRRIAGQASVRCHFALTAE